MNYIVQRKPDPSFWSWYADQDRAGTPIALQRLHFGVDGDEDITSHVGLRQIRDYLTGLDFKDDDRERWPVTIRHGRVRSRPMLPVA
jgi:hypothetical protein